MVDDHIIGIVSDTHDNMPAIRKAVEAFNKAGCSLVVHAGDFIAPFTVMEFEKLKARLVGVFGNNDGEKKGLSKQFAPVGVISEPPYEFDHLERKCIVMHAPDYLELYINDENFDVVIYGHVHKIDVRRGKPVVINPGECCSWLTGRSTVALLNLKTMEPEILDL